MRLYISVTQTADSKYKVRGSEDAPKQSLTVETRVGDEWDMYAMVLRYISNYGSDKVVCEWPSEDPAAEWQKCRQLLDECFSSNAAYCRQVIYVHCGKPCDCKNDSSKCFLHMCPEHRKACDADKSQCAKDWDKELDTAAAEHSESSWTVSSNDDNGESTPKCQLLRSSTGLLLCQEPVFDNYQLGGKYICEKHQKQPTHSNVSECPRADEKNCSKYIIDGGSHCHNCRKYKASLAITCQHIGRSGRQCEKEVRDKYNSKDKYICAACRKLKAYGTVKKESMETS